MKIFNKKSKKEEKAELAKEDSSFSSTNLQFSLPRRSFSGLILEKPWLSEKALRLRSQGQYVFLVKPEANKRLIREEVERRFGVKVKSVNIVKKKREKKAIVTLMPGQQIDI